MLNHRSHATTTLLAADDEPLLAELNTIHDAYSVSGSSPPAHPPSNSRRTQDQLLRLAYTPDEAAHVLGVSRSLFYQRVLPHLKTVSLGRKRLIPVAELEVFLSTRASRALP
jgi:excisionase family DNA binding protein